MGEVVSLQGEPLGAAGEHTPADEVLANAIGCGIRQVIVIGRMADGSFFTSGSDSNADAVFLLEQGKYHLLFDDNEENT